MSGPDTKWRGLTSASGRALCVRLTPHIVWHLALAPFCAVSGVPPVLRFIFIFVLCFWVQRLWNNLRAVLQTTRVMFLWPEAEGVCCIPQGMLGSLQEDGTALGDCVGWSVVISIQPGDSSWEEGRPETGSTTEIQHMGRQGSGYRAHTPPLLAYTHPEELSRLLCGFYYHMHPPGVKHWAEYSPCKPLKPSVLLKNFLLMKNCSRWGTTSADNLWIGGKCWEISAAFQLLSAWNWC